MRFVTAALVSMALLGAVALCQYTVRKQIEFSLSRDVDEHGDHAADTARNTVFSIVVTPAFNARQDPFALSLSEDEETPRIVVSHEGQVLLRYTEDVLSGQTLTISDQRLSGETAALFVQANPGPDDAMRPCALRLQVFADQVLCDESTIWSEGQGQPVSGEVVLELSPRRAKLDRGLGERDQ